MSRSKYGYKSLLKDDGFRDLNLLKTRQLIGLALSEALGTACFVALGCGNVVQYLGPSRELHSTTHLNTVFSFAFGIATSIAIFGHISGALMNPALNMAWLALGQMSLPKFLFYTLFQLIGATLGVGIVRMISDVDDGFCVPQPGSEVSLPVAFVAEALTTTVLCLLFCSVVDPRNKQHAGSIYLKFAIGVTAIAIPSAKYAGCSMNPARAFGPALLASMWTHHWVYWVAPLLAAAITGLLYRVFFDPELAAEEPNQDRQEEDKREGRAV